MNEGDEEVSYGIFAHWFSLNQIFKFSVSFATEEERNRPSHGCFNRGLCSTKELKRATGPLSPPTKEWRDLKSLLLSWKTCIRVHLNAWKGELSWLACGCHRFFSLFSTLAKSVISSLLSFSFSRKDVLFTVWILEFFLTFLLLFCVHEIKSLFAENHGRFLKFCC